VEFMGGADNLLVQAKKSYDKGEYRWVAEVLKHLVFADPKNQVARNLLADAYEQLGYIAESGPWRNFYITGARELRIGLKTFPIGGTSSPDMINGMSSELFFNYLAMRYKGTEENTNKHNFNLALQDTNEKVSLILSNGTVSTRVGSFLSKDVTATITGNRLAIAGLTTPSSGIKLDDLISSGKLKIEGDVNAFKEFLSHIDNFEFWFNIIEP
jgi:alkyl sulfatase BDS1-like metallo-beta-lactamase superfamily hydrolase